MSLELWQQVDRWALLEELRLLTLSADHGLLVVSGNDDSVRSTACDLSFSFLTTLGFRTHLILESSYVATPVRSLLIKAWMQTEGPKQATQVPRSVSQSSFLSERQILQEIARSCEDSEKVAFVFDTVDSDISIPLHYARLFEELSRLARCYVVVLSRRESRSSFPPSCRSITVAEMPLAEIRWSLLTSPAFATVQGSIVNPLLTALTNAAVGGVVSAQEAYDLIQRELQRESA